MFGFDKDTDLKKVTKDAMIHGHSTPYMAGVFARNVGAKRLILNHFSARYRGDATLESMTVMTRIERQAIKASKLGTDKVAAAWDVSRILFFIILVRVVVSCCCTLTVIFPVPFLVDVVHDLSGSTCSLW